MFSDKNLDIVNICIKELFNNKEDLSSIKEEDYPDVRKIFATLSNHNIKDFILIPHYNNKKSKGISVSDVDKQLGRLCFNAYEDANNVENLKKSLKCYLDANCADFPFVAFTDNHNIHVYPDGKNGHKNEKCYFLGNIDSPFNTVRNAFYEPRLRISINGVDGMRSISHSKNSINYIEINGKKIFFSPYQNSIIGRFGSGKSLLIELVRRGNSQLKDSDYYKDLYEESNSVKIGIAGNKYDSLEEVKVRNDLKIYNTLQHENYYSKNSLDKDEITNLLGRMNIEFEPEKSIPLIGDLNKLVDLFNELEKSFNSQESNNLNYKKAFNKNDYIHINSFDEDDNSKAAIDYLNQVSSSLNEVYTLKVLNIDIFNQKEKKAIFNTSELIRKKVGVIQSFIDEPIWKQIETNLAEYSRLNDTDQEKISLEHFKTNLKSFLYLLLDLKSECHKLDDSYSPEKWSTLKQKNYRYLTDDKNYKLIYQYEVKDDFKEAEEIIFKANDRKGSLYLSIISYIQLNNKKEKKLANNKSFSDNTNKLKEKANSAFIAENVKYDIEFKDKDEKYHSMLQKSAGQKSTLFINMLFEFIKNDLKNNMPVILILDQPEDNIDNKNIYEAITNKIKEFKIHYPNFQILLVTHNANVAITADSENIIIAKESNGNGLQRFRYETGGIENTDYIDKVCDILEGGREALKARATKYGINIIKKVDQNV